MARRRVRGDGDHPHRETLYAALGEEQQDLAKCAPNVHELKTWEVPLDAVFRSLDVGP